MARHGPSQIGSSNPLRSRSPCGARSHPSILPCSILSASLRSALQLPIGLPSLPPFGARLRFGGLSFPNSGQVALPLNQGQWSFAKSRRSPHLSLAHPQGAATPSPVFPHGTTGAKRIEHTARPSCDRPHGCRGGLVLVHVGGGHGGDTRRRRRPHPGAGAADESVTPLLRSSAGALGTAAGDGALGLRTPYDEPPAPADPAQPGVTINSGAPAGPVHRRGGRPAPTASPQKTRCRRTWRCALAAP